MTGLAIIDNALIVVKAHSSSVQIYDKVSLELQSNADILAMKDPYDVVGQGQFLYVSERTEKNIHRIHFNPTAWTETWNIGYCCMALSLPNQDRLLAACCVVNETQFIGEYNLHNGSLIRQISCSRIPNIRHAISSANGTYLVTHGRWGCKLRRVCVVDKEGGVIKSYGGPWGSKIGKLNEPIRLTVNKNGFIFVLDYSNNNVIMLNSNLEFVREVIPKTTLCQPYRMYLDDVTGRLYIGDGKGNNNRIICFDTQ